MTGAALFATATAATASWLVTAAPTRLSRITPRPPRGAPPRWLLAVPVALVAGPVPAIGVAVGLIALPGVLAAGQRSRERAELPAATAGFAAALAAELRAGAPPERALAHSLAEAPPALRPALRRAMGAAELGGDVAGALRGAAAAPAPGPLVRRLGGAVAWLGARPDAPASGSRWPQRRPDPQETAVLGQLAAAWQVAHESGAGLAPVLDTLAEALRAADRRNRETAAALAGPRTTAWLLAALPAIGVLLAAGLGARPGDVLLHTPLGLGALLAGGALDVVGVLWTRRLVRRAMAPS